MRKTRRQTTKGRQRKGAGLFSRFLRRVTGQGQSRIAVAPNNVRIEEQRHRQAQRPQIQRPQIQRPPTRRTTATATGTGRTGRTRRTTNIRVLPSIGETERHDYEDDLVNRYNLRIEPTAIEDEEPLEEAEAVIESIPLATYNAESDTYDIPVASMKGIIARPSEITKLEVYEPSLKPERASTKVGGKKRSTKRRGRKRSTNKR
jgi:hypothetical protein